MYGGVCRASWLLTAAVCGIESTIALVATAELCESVLPNHFHMGRPQTSACTMAALAAHIVHTQC